MAKKVLFGTVIDAKTFERHRVSFVTMLRDGSDDLRLLSAMMLVKRNAPDPAMPDAPPSFSAPVRAGWENYQHTFPDQTQNAEMIGALIAVPDGKWKGHVDWLRPTDTEKPQLSS